MGADWPGEADEPAEGDSSPDASRSGGGRRVPAETRSREEYYDELHRTVSATARQSAAEEQAAAEKWDEAAEESRWMWTEYERKWPPGERPPVDTSADPPGSWRADGDRFLPAATNKRVDAECDRIADRERDRISPAMRAVESQDPDRQLIGFDDRRKGRDRIKEKICGMIRELNFTPAEAVSLVPDAIRYTLQYREGRYTQGVREDIERLKGQGFELHKLKNSWAAEEYKGINTQWIEPGSGQRFEVQFHTRISFEAKQLTHTAYERLRTQQADEFEKMVLKAFQRKVSAEVPVPPHADAIPDYPERDADAR
ncbi:MAG TPA: hypothetical protein VFW50_25895 [Streptosporangiaceae bacterium]|nr:hypothetical protein [Streptosporangiaceae bacterium]